MSLPLPPPTGLTDFRRKLTFRATSDNDKKNGFLLGFEPPNFRQVKPWVKNGYRTKPNTLKNIVIAFQNQSTTINAMILLRLYRVLYYCYCRALEVVWEIPTRIRYWLYRMALWYICSRMLGTACLYRTIILCGKPLLLLLSTLIVCYPSSRPLQRPGKAWVIYMGCPHPRYTWHKLKHCFPLFLPASVLSFFLPLFVYSGVFGSLTFLWFGIFLFLFPLFLFFPCLSFVDSCLVVCFLVDVVHECHDSCLDLLW